MTARLSRSAAEKAVLRVAREVLERDDVSLDDDFFAAGGDSLAAMFLLGRLREETGVALRVRTLFDASTLRQLVERVTEVATAADDSPAPPTRAQLRATFEDND